MCDKFVSCSDLGNKSSYCPFRPFVLIKAINVSFDEETGKYRVVYDIHVENQSSTVEPIRLLSIWNSSIYTVENPSITALVSGAPVGEPVPVVTSNVTVSTNPLLQIDQMVLGAYVRLTLTVLIDKSVQVFNNSLLVRSGDQQPLFPPFCVTESVDLTQTICINGKMCSKDF